MTMMAAEAGETTRARLWIRRRTCLRSAGMSGGGPHRQPGHHAISRRFDRRAVQSGHDFWTSAPTTSLLESRCNRSSRLGLSCSITGESRFQSPRHARRVFANVTRRPGVSAAMLMDLPRFGRDHNPSPNGARRGDRLPRRALGGLAVHGALDERARSGCRRQQREAGHHNLPGHAGDEGHRGTSRRESRAQRRPATMQPAFRPRNSSPRSAVVREAVVRHRHEADRR